VADWDVVSHEPAQADPWAVVSHEPQIAAAPKEGDPVPAGGPPQGFYAVTEHDGKQTLRHESGLYDVMRALSDLPGVGMAERMGQGAVRLGGKAASGIAGMLGGGNEAVQGVQGAVNQATELPPTHDPLVAAQEALTHVVGEAAAPIDRAVGNLPAGPRTAIEATEEAIPDVGAVLGLRALAPRTAAVQEIARSPAEVSKAAGYTGLKTKADLAAPGNQAITDTLIGQDAGIVPGQRPSVASLENAIKVGPARVYRQAEESIPERLTMRGDPLEQDLGNLPQQVSQLPRSPDVTALQETMLSQPEFSRDELFANIREARERAKAHWKSDDPDKGALGDAYHSLANAYEDFAGRQLEAANSPVSLADWQAARTQMAKNYQAQGALRGEHFDPHVYGKIAERNPHLLTSNAAIVGHVANHLPVGAASSGLLPTALGAAAGEAAGHLAGAPVVGGVMGAAAGPLIRAQLHDLLRRGRPDLAASTAGNPALSYFFDRGRMPPGWNRAPSSPLPAPFGGYLPAPSMVNAGGGASTPSTLESLGLTPDVQAAGAAHPAAARLAALREQLAQAPERPAEPVEFQGPQKWGDFSIAPQQPPAPAPQASKIVDEGGNPLVLYHGTNANFDTFDPARGQEYGIYLTPSMKYAGMYGPNVKAVHADLRNPLYVENKGEIAPRNLTKEDIDGLRAQGYDGIVSVTPGKPVSKAHEVVAFAPEQVRPVGAPAPPAVAPGGIPFENVLEQGGTQRPPVGAPGTIVRPAAKSPKQQNVRTPPGAPTIATAPPPGPSPAQLAFRNKLAADRLRKVAGDLSLEGPGGATGSPIDRAREALERRQRGYARGGSVHAFQN
jgi:ADP-Ribosyltransferase in polyvalent proteins